MEASEHGSPATWPPRCASCGKILGVYEPLVCVIDGVPRQTSRAGAPHLARNADVCYHVACEREAMQPVSPGSTEK
jgi:hypothetical protein